MAIVVENEYLLLYENDASPAITITSATAGNLLVAGCSDRVDPGGAPTVPTGFTEIEGFDGTALDGSWAYKIAAGGETSLEFTGLGSGSDGMLVAIEVSGVAQTSPLEDNDSDLTNANTAVNNQNSGSATAVQASGIAVACFMKDNTGNMVAKLEMLQILQEQLVKY